MPLVGDTGVWGRWLGCRAFEGVSCPCRRTLPRVCLWPQMTLPFLLLLCPSLCLWPQMSPLGRTLAASQEERRQHELLGEHGPAQGTSVLCSSHVLTPSTEPPLQGREPVFRA